MVADKDWRLVSAGGARAQASQCKSQVGWGISFWAVCPDFRETAVGALSPFRISDGGALAKQGETASPSSGAGLREDAGGEGAVGQGERREGGKTKRGDFFPRPPFIVVSNWFNRSSKSYTGGASWGLLGEALSPTNQGKTASPSW